MSTKHRRPAAECEAPNRSEIGRILTQLTRDRKLAMVLRLVADLVETDGQPSSPPVDSAALMTIAQLQASGRHVTTGWARTHVAEAGRGPRRAPLYRLADVDAALASAARPPRKSRPITGVNVDPIDEMLARGELVARRGR